MPSTYQAYTKMPLSGAATGLGILVASTGPAGTAGTTIHTAVTGSDSIDEIVLYASNSSSSAGGILLTLQWGEIAVSGVVYPDEIKYLLVPVGNGLTALTAPLILNGALLVTAYAATINVIQIFGFVNRIALV